MNEDRPNYQNVESVNALSSNFEKVPVTPGSGVRVTLPIGVLRQLLPSTSLWEALGQGRIPARPPIRVM